MASSAERRTPDADLRAAIWLTLGLTLLRIVALFRTPLDLYPDEAQYWLWSRTLDFGYYSKPPMIAWAIWATTHLGGDAEAWVRLSAPLFQGGATLAVFAIGRRLYGGPAGLAGAALYALAPAIQLSSAVIATDAPMLFFLGLTILAYVALQKAEGRTRLALAAGFGAALGLAFLSKYAAVYAVVGLVLHLALSREARRAWSPATAGAALAAFVLTLSPNLIWNANHGFATLHHTAANADWGARKLFNFGELGEFLASQAGVFGPIPAGALVVGVVLALRKRRIAPSDLMLLCFVAPPLLIVSAQAFISRANANWAAASYLPAAVLAGAWLVRWRARRWLTAALAVQALAAVAFLTFTLSPHLAEAAGAANSFKRAKGWRQASAMILERARTEQPAGLSAIAVDNRFLFYSLAYYGRDFFADPLNPPLKVWLGRETAQNQAELSAPLTPANGARVLVASYEGRRTAEANTAFGAVRGREIASIYLDRKHRRRVELFVGEGYRGPSPPPVSAPSTPP